MPTKKKRSLWVYFAGELLTATKDTTVTGVKVRRSKAYRGWHSQTEFTHYDLSPSIVLSVVDDRPCFAGAGFSTDFQSELPAAVCDRVNVLSVPHHGTTVGSRLLRSPESLYQGAMIRILPSMSSFEDTVDIQSQNMQSGWHASTNAAADLAGLNPGNELVMQEWTGTTPLTIHFSEMQKCAEMLLRDISGSTAKLFLAWRNYYPAAARTRPVMTPNERILTDPEQLLKAFESPDLPVQARRSLALFAETLRFDESQKTRLVQKLWNYVTDRRTSQDKDELVALGSAIRKLIACWPVQRFDELAGILNISDTSIVQPEIELEVAKGLVYRFSWDADATFPDSPLLRDTLYDLASFHSSKRVVDHEDSSAIAINAFIALAFLRDSRTVEFVQSLRNRSLPWFVVLVRSRMHRLLTRLKAERRRSSESLGLLPDAVRELSGEGK